MPIHPAPVIAIWSKGKGSWLLMKCRCADCGYLTLKRRGSLETVTADAEYRANGTIPIQGNFYVFNALPVCWKGERIGTGGEPDRNLECHKLVIADRECQSFTKWHPGYTAERHDEMELLRKVEAMNAVARMEDKAETERRHQENVNATKNAYRLSVISLIVAVLCAVIAATLPFYLMRT